MNTFQAFVIYLLVGAVLGGVCFDYVLDYVFDKDVPYYYDALCGVVTAPLIVPYAIACFILKQAGVRPNIE